MHYCSHRETNESLWIPSCRGNHPVNRGEHCPSPASPSRSSHLAQPFPAAGTAPRCLLEASPGQKQREGAVLCLESASTALWWLTWHCHTGQAKGLCSGKLFPVESLMPGSGLAAGTLHCCHITDRGRMAAAKLSVGNRKMEHTKASCSAVPCLPSSQVAEEAQHQKPWKSFN